MDILMQQISQSRAFTSDRASVFEEEPDEELPKSLGSLYLFTD